MAIAISSELRAVALSLVPRSRRPRLASGVLVVLLVAVAAAAWLGLRGLAARDHLEAARSDLVAAQDALLDADIARARAATDRARGRTASARDLTGDPIWRLAGALPVLGASPRAVTQVAAAVDDLVADVLTPALDAAELLEPTTLRGPDGAFDLARLRAAAAPVRQAASGSGRVLATLDGVALERAVPPVAEAVRELLAETRRLDDALGDAASVVEIAPRLLGEDRPRRYLLVVQQTAETRATGGILGGFVVLEASAGKLGTVEQGSNADFPRGRIPPPPGVSDDYLRLYEPAGALRFVQNANLTPDVPMAARVFAARWQAGGGEPLDAVVLLDARALALILRGSGPIPVPGGEVTPEQLPQYLAVGQYRDFPTLAREDVLGRKDELGRIAEVVASRLVDGGGDTRALLTGAVDAVRSGRAKVASDDEVLGPVLAQSGLDGALATDRPLVQAVVNNASAGKLDHFLERRLSWQAQGCGDGVRRRSTVRFELRNDVPADELPPYLTIDFVDGQRLVTRDLRLNVAVYATKGADLVEARLDGVPLDGTDPAAPGLSVNEESGHPRFQVPVVVPQGGSRVLELVLDEPVVAGAPLVREQPLSRDMAVDLDVPTCAP